MKEIFAAATEYSVIVIETFALVAILVGSVEAFGRGLATMLGSSGAHHSREVWLRYARWLVGGLTFQLAADIIETALAPTWEEIGRIASIAAIRTALNYFLERDLKEIEAREREVQAA